MASLRRIHLGSLLLVACCLLLAGCGRTRKTAGDKAKEPSDEGVRLTPARASIPNDLSQLALAYTLCLNEGKPPANAEALAAWFENDEKLLGKLQSGEIVFLYGVGTKQMRPEGPSRTVIAYEKDAPTRGGYVVFADRAVKKVTADEFKTLKLAGQKKK